MNIEKKISSFPEYAKDIKLNYTKILNEAIFNKQQLYGIILISCLACKQKELISAATEDAKEHLDEPMLEDTYGAYSIMSMNAVYYRFTHLVATEDYNAMPANLRMQYLAKFKTNKQDFEMLCLAVAVIMGCGKCINAHEAILKENNVSPQQIQSVARIASIMSAISRVMDI